MTDGWTRVKSGALILVSLAVLVGGYMWFSNFKISRNTRHYKVNVSRASWIQKGTLVTISGVAKGRVDEIQLYPDSVVIFISLEDYPLRQGARAYIENQGVMGERRIDLYMGSGDTLEQWATIPGEDSPTIGDLVEYAGQLMEDVDSLAVEARTALRGAARRTDQLQIQLSATLSEIEGLSRDLRASTHRITAKSDTSFAKLDTLITHLDTLSLTLHQMAESQGTVQRLAEDDQIYREMEKTLKSTQELLDDIRNNPRKYIHIEIF